MENIKIIIPETPDFKGLIDKDILDRFKDYPVFYEDIINAQLIKTTKELIKIINRELKPEIHNFDIK